VIAFTFPGQGSQRPGMGAPWVDEPSWALVAEASEVAGRDLARLLLDADADELRHTRNAQLTTFVLSLVVLDAVDRLGVAPSAAAGHSLGEYTALTATGALSFADGVRLVAARGEAMQTAAEAHPGTMAAVLGLDDEAAEVACRQTGGEVWVANFNAPGQIVIAGTAAAIARVSTRAGEEKGKAIALKVSAPFHCALMAPAAAALRSALDKVDVKALTFPVVANVDARPNSEPARVKELLVRQVDGAVRWEQAVRLMHMEGITHAIEIGPGKVLAGLGRRIAKEMKIFSVGDAASLEGLGEFLTQPYPSSTEPPPGTMPPPSL
jgi:[acyl-carrier-protein] S-malonyltransferase